MADTTEYDLIVIGGGPAGYAGAIRAGQLGKKVACIELERAGGTCLNWGCIPTKALLKSAELYQKMKKAEAYGLTVKEVGFDFARVMDRSRSVAGQMAKGVEFLFRKNKVDYVPGAGQVSAPGMVAAARWGNANQDKVVPYLVKYLKADPALAAAEHRPVFAERLVPAQIQPWIDVTAKYAKFAPFPASDIIYVPK